MVVVGVSKLEKNIHKQESISIIHLCALHQYVDTLSEHSFFFLIGSSQTHLVHITTYCIGLCTTYAIVLVHRMTITNVKADQQGRGEQLCLGMVRSNHA